LPNAPAKAPFPVLVYGGSTAMGVFGIQYLKASGLTVLTTSSPSNFAYLKSLGADATFDYHSPTCGADIRAFTQNGLRYAWDCSGGGEAICAAALSDAEPSKYGCINVPNAEALKTNPLVAGPFVTIAYEVIGEAFLYGDNPCPVKIDEVEFFLKFFELTRELLESGTIKPIKLTVNKTGGGLDGVIMGLDELRAGRVSGTKLVYTL
jgi:NADPH:quinone reductase-like Zn-dependent oxidoreductase